MDMILFCARICGVHSLQHTHQNMHNYAQKSKPDVCQHGQIQSRLTLNLPRKHLTRSQWPGHSHSLNTSKKITYNWMQREIHSRIGMLSCIQKTPLSTQRRDTSVPVAKQSSRYGLDGHSRSISSL